MSSPVIRPSPLSVRPHLPREALRPTRAWLVACSLALSLALGACGGQEAHRTDAGAENNGVYIQAGPITYQLSVSRVLNPYSAEDSQYLAGLPARTRGPKPDELWYGVFLWAKNQSKHDASTTRNFVIEDTQGTKYYPIAVNPAVNGYAWTPQTLPPSASQPGPDTLASFGPTQGGLLLFKLNTSVYSNRPVTLSIYASGQSKPSTISLDL